VAEVSFKLGVQVLLSINFISKGVQSDAIFSILIPDIHLNGVHLSLFQKILVQNNLMVKEGILISDRSSVDS